MERKEVLLMYSGGKDSVACIVKLIKEGYRVHLINFDNGCISYTGYETTLALKLEQLYGEQRVYWGGVLSNLVYLREHMHISSTIPFSEFLKKYGDFSESQLRCLNCRTAMYRVAIVYAIQNGIKFIAEGARKSQLFAVEQEPMRKKYVELCQEFGIELLWPVYEATDEQIRNYHSDICLALSPEFLYPNKNGYVIGESKCLLGMPVASIEDTNDNTTLQERIENEADVAAIYYEKVMGPHIRRNLKRPDARKLHPSRKGGPVSFYNAGD